MIKKEELEKLRIEYPIGCYVELIKMDDKQAPPIHTKGFVSHIDDIGTIFVKWKNGSSLGVVYGEDEIRKIKCKKCGADIIGYPAISRYDENVELCSDCGNREALEIIGKSTKEIEEVVEKINAIKKETVAQ